MTSRHGPTSLAAQSIAIDQSVSSASTSLAQDTAYIMMKSAQPQQETPIPGWTGFNINISQPLPVSVIHYLPVIEASPTDLSTVNHILSDAVTHADRLECDSVMVVFDQAIYSKVQQIRWANKAIEQRLVPRLGEFHTVMCFLSAIGKRFKLAGLEDVLIESNVVAPGSMNGVLSGHMYNRSIRAHKILFEALSRMQFTQFLSNLDDDAKARHDAQISELIRCYHNAEEVNTDSISDLQKLFAEYVEQQCKSNPLFAYWTSYLNMITILLAFIRATRTSNWALHLASLRMMLPWMFAYDRTNYAR